MTDVQDTTTLTREQSDEALQRFADGFSSNLRAPVLHSPSEHKLLHRTRAGAQLWASLPDPLERLYDIAFAGISASDLATVARVLSAATRQLLATRNEGTSP